MTKPTPAERRVLDQACVCLNKGKSRGVRPKRYDVSQTKREGESGRLQFGQPPACGTLEWLVVTLQRMKDGPFYTSTVNEVLKGYLLSPRIGLSENGDRILRLAGRPGSRAIRTLVQIWKDDQIARLKNCIWCGHWFWKHASEKENGRRTCSHKCAKAIENAVDSNQRFALARNAVTEFERAVAEKRQAVSKKV